MTQQITIKSGRRRTAVASAKLTPGHGEITINGRPFDDYFSTATQRTLAVQPLLATENLKKFNIEIKTKGGGLVGQAGAVSLAISRSLITVHPELRAILKPKGMLMRDPRMKERKKSGQPGARKRFQFSKR